MDVLGLLNLLLVGLLVGWVLLVGFTTFALLRPPRRAYGWAVARSLPGDPSELRLAGRPPDERLEWSEWKLSHDGDELPVWDIIGLGPSGPVVILTHGWGDSRTTMLASGRVAAALPVVSRLVMWDMPGHGDARGRGCSLGLREPAALRALIERVADAEHAVILWGFSLGARVSVLASRECPLVRAVIAEAPYLHPATPARNVLGLQGLPFRSNLGPALLVGGVLRGQPFELCRPRHQLDEVAASLDTPLLVIHGDQDAVSPPEDGRRLAQAAKHGEFASIPAGQHQTLWFAGETAKPSTASLTRFLKSLQAARPAPAAPSR